MEAPRGAHAELTRFFVEVGHPQNAAKIPQLLTRFNGRYDELVVKLEAKYHHQLSHESAPLVVSKRANTTEVSLSASSSSGEASPSASPRLASTACERVAFEDELRVYFAAVGRPELVGKVPGLVARFEGRWPKLVRSLEAKYTLRVGARVEGVLSSPSLQSPRVNSTAISEKAEEEDKEDEEDEAVEVEVIDLDPDPMPAASPDALNSIAAHGINTDSDETSTSSDDEEGDTFPTDGNATAPPLPSAPAMSGAGVRSARKFSATDFQNDESTMMGQLLTLKQRFDAGEVSPDGLRRARARLMRVELGQAEAEAKSELEVHLRRRKRSNAAALQRTELAGVAALEEQRRTAEVRLFMYRVTFRANPAHSLTRSPTHITFDWRLRPSARRWRRRQRHSPRR